MTTNTPCFHGFIKLLSDSYDILITEADYSLGVNNFISHWKSAMVEELSTVYCQAWNDAARSYKSF